MNRPSAPAVPPAELAAEPVPPPLDGPTPIGAEDAPAARRNAGPLLAVLRRVLPGDGTVLEIGAGTGQHAAAFAAALAPRRWLPTDPQSERLTSAPLWAASMPTALRPQPARVLDAHRALQDWPVTAQDGIRAVVATNVVHIAPWEVALGILAGAAGLLTQGDPLILYGPYKRAGRHTGDGNVAFDASLRSRDPTWGIRDLDSELVPAAAAAGFVLDLVQPMPADNLTVVFRRSV